MVPQTEEVHESLGRFVRAVRKRAGLTANQLADTISRSSTWLYRLEHDERADPQATDLDSIAAACSLSTYEQRYLYLLADKVPPAVGLADNTMARYLETFGGPSAWIDGKGSSIYNSEFRRLFIGAENYRDIVHWHFESPDAKRILQNWDEIAAWWVGVARHYLAYGGSEALTNSLQATMESDEFRTRWQQQTIPRDPASLIWFVNDLETSKLLIIDQRLWIQPYRNGVLVGGAVLA